MAPRNRPALDAPWYWSLAGTAGFTVGFVGPILLGHYTDLLRDHVLKTPLTNFLIFLLVTPGIALIVDLIIAVRRMIRRRVDRALGAGLAAVFALAGPFWIVSFLLSLSGGFPG